MPVPAADLRHRVAAPLANSTGAHPPAAEGPAGLASPRHRMPFNPRNEGSCFRPPPVSFLPPWFLSRLPPPYSHDVAGNIMPGSAAAMSVAPATWSGTRRRRCNTYSAGTI